ncbi:hypothetical protein [Caballeronia sp. LjRoot31]|uniref:hypothetical protein n=1 Tax=Caballeronia sp. LjRoot31 TaxID=3342324 RepID=UPI003ECC72DE
MNGFEVIDLNSNLVALGRLEQLDSLGYRPKQSIGLPYDTPVLTCPVAAHDAECFSMKEGQANFGFGRIHTQQGLLQSIRVQINDVQIFWLTDITDPEVWAVLEKWRKAKHALIQFDVRGQTEEQGYRYLPRQGCHKANTRTNSSEICRPLQPEAYGTI